MAANIPGTSKAWDQFICGHGEEHKGYSCMVWDMADGARFHLILTKSFDPLEWETIGRRIEMEGWDKERKTWHPEAIAAILYNSYGRHMIKKVEVLHGR